MFSIIASVTCFWAPQVGGTGYLEAAVVVILAEVHVITGSPPGGGPELMQWQDGGGALEARTLDLVQLFCEKHLPGAVSLL